MKTKLIPAALMCAILASCTMATSNMQKGTASFVMLGSDASKFTNTPYGTNAENINNSRALKTAVIGGVTAYGINQIAGAFKHSESLNASTSNAKTAAGVSNTKTAARAGVANTTVKAKTAVELAEIQSKTKLGLKALNNVPTP
jgi:hypothetical protein